MRAGYEQPQPRVVLVELAQMTVMRVPDPVLQVALDRLDNAVHDLRDIRAKPEVELRAWASSTRSG